MRQPRWIAHSLVICAFAWAIAACTKPGDAPRARVLAALPAGARFVLVGDGDALGSALLRPAIERARWFVPDALACVLDLALTSSAAGIATDDDGAVVVIATTGVVHCPALSELAPGLWAATIGTATTVAANAANASIAHAGAWERARPALASSPIALVRRTSHGALIAAMQLAPFDAWLVVDGTLVGQVTTSIEQGLAAWRERASAVTADLTHRDGQLAVRVHRADAAALAALVDLGRHAFEPAPAVADPAGPIACTLRPPTVRCLDPSHPRVSDLRETLLALGTGAKPVVEAADVVGLQLASDSPIGLRAGDQLLAIDGRQITSADDLAAAAQAARQVALVVRRGSRTSVIEITSGE